MPATTWLHAALLEPMIKMMRFWAGSGVFMMIPGAESTFLHSKLMMSWTEPERDVEPDILHKVLSLSLSLSDRT